MLPNGTRWYQLSVEETFRLLDADKAGLTCLLCGNCCKILTLSA